jgi:hypothetical protein
MKMDIEKLTQIQTILKNDDESVEFTEDDFSKGLWYISNNQVHRFGKDNPKEGASIERTYSNQRGIASLTDFLEKIKDLDLKARVFIGHENGKEQYKTYYAWNKLADALGISELVTVATKIPKNVAKRFELFANENGGRSLVLRTLVYGYVEKQIKQNAESLMFKEDI